MLFEQAQPGRNRPGRKCILRPAIQSDRRYFPAALINVSPLGAPKPVTLSQPLVTVSEPSPQKCVPDCEICEQDKAF